MNRMKKLIMAVCAICIFAVVPAMAEGLKIMTEEYPPFNYTENGKVTGLGTDVVLELAKKVGNPTDIEVKPWARAYALIQKEDGMILYTMTRTEAREDMFKWVGPVASNKWVFFAKKGSDIKLASLDDAKKIGKIGTYKDDATELFLKEQGFTNLDSVVDDSLNVPKLMAGRIDLWAVGELQGIYKAKQQGVGDQLEKMMDIKDAELYIAFSKNTPDDVVAKWQAALDEMKADGSFDVLVKKYM